MATWTNKQWGALIAGLVVFLIALIGVGETALVVIFAIIGYFIGKYLDGEIDADDLRDRAQGRGSASGSASVRVETPPPPPRY